MNIEISDQNIASSGQRVAVSKPVPCLTALKVFLPFAFGYLLSYLFRVVNAVIAPNLAADLNIDPSQLGLLTATYFIAFASSQLPLGIFLDRLGPRVVESVLLLFAGMGAFVFFISKSLTGLIIGRALIGFGVSACLMAAFKSYVLFFPEKSWPRVNGFQMAAGGLGAMCATTPVEWILQITDWRGLFLMLAVACLVTAVGIFLVVPEKNIPASKETLASQIDGVRKVFTDPHFFNIAPLVTVSQAGFLSVQGLWAGPWLRDMAGLSRPEIANILFWSAFAMVCGYILFGFLAEKLSRKGFSVRATAVAGMTFFIGTQVMIVLNPALPVIILWILFGFFGTSGILSYAALSSCFPKALSGRVTTSINMLVFVAAFILQWAIGSIIHLWETSPEGHYHPSGYLAGFLMVSCLQISGLIWFWFSRKFIPE